jgi:hypothetical protein
MHILESDLNSLFAIETEGSSLFLFTEDRDLINKSQEILEEAGYTCHDFWSGLQVRVVWQGQSADQVAELLAA